MPVQTGALPGVTVGLLAMPVSTGMSVVTQKAKGSSRLLADIQSKPASEKPRC